MMKMGTTIRAALLMMLSVISASTETPTEHATWTLLFDEAGEPKPAFWPLVQPLKK